MPAPARQTPPINPENYTFSFPQHKKWVVQNSCAKVGRSCFDKKGQHFLESVRSGLRGGGWGTSTYYSLNTVRPILATKYPGMPGRIFEMETVRFCPQCTRFCALFCARFCPNGGALYSSKKSLPRTFPHLKTLSIPGPILSKKHPSIPYFIHRSNNYIPDLCV